MTLQSAFLLYIISGTRGETAIILQSSQVADLVLLCQYAIVTSPKSRIYDLTNFKPKFKGYVLTLVATTTVCHLVICTREGGVCV